MQLQKKVNAKIDFFILYIFKEGGASRIGRSPLGIES